MTRFSESYKSAKQNIIWNYVGTIFNMGINFLILPFLLFFLNTDEMGLWYVMVSFSNIANLFSFGFTPAFARNVNYCWNGAQELKKTGKDHDVKKNEAIDFRLLKRILVTSQLLYLIFAVLGTFLIAVAGTFHIWNIAAAIMTKQIKLSWLIFLIAIFLNIYYGYYSSYLMGIGRVDAYNKILVIAGVIRILFMGIFMYLGMGILGAAGAYLIYGLILRIFNRNIFYRTNGLKKELSQLRKEIVSFAEIKECLQTVWYNAWRDGVVSIAEYLSTQANTLVCSYFMTLSDTAMFSLTVQLVTAIGKIAKSIHNAYTPVFQSSYITGDKKNSRESQAFCIFAYSIVYLAGILGLMTVGIPLIHIFKSTTNLNRNVIAGYAVYQFMLSYRNCYGSYLSCTNRVWYWKSYLLTSFFSICIYTILMALTVPNVWYIIVVSIIGEAVYNFWKWPVLVNKELGIGWKYIITCGCSTTRKLIYEKGKVYEKR